MAETYIDLLSCIIAKAAGFDPDMAASDAGLGAKQGTVAQHFNPTVVEIIRAMVKAGWKPPEQI